MITIKDKNVRDLADAEEIKRDGKNTRKNGIKKILMKQITTMV